MTEQPKEQTALLLFTLIQLVYRDHVRPQVYSWVIDTETKVDDHFLEVLDYLFNYNQE